MASPSPNPNNNSLYPQVMESNHTDWQHQTSSSFNNVYPKIDISDFPADEALEEEILNIRGAILNLIDHHYSVELASGDLSIIRLRQGNNVLALLARIGDDIIQWPLAKDVAAVKLDHSHYFFSLPFPHHVLNYGLTIASKGQEASLHHLDSILVAFTCFSVQSVSDVLQVNHISPADSDSDNNREVLQRNCAAYWTTLAPNVDDYSASAARFIASGSAHLIKGILWCGDVTAHRLLKGNEIIKNTMSPNAKTDISPHTLSRIKRVKRMTKMTEKVANGVLSGVVKVSGFFTSSVADSKVGKKFFSLLPGEIVLASLDGFNKVCDAVEVAGKNVMSTSSTVTTELVSHRYGDEAAEATNEGLDAAGHAIGTAWAAFKIRKALNPKGVLKPSNLAKSAIKAAAAEKKAGKSSR